MKIIKYKTPAILALSRGNALTICLIMSWNAVSIENGAVSLVNSDRFQCIHSSRMRRLAPA